MIYIHLYCNEAGTFNAAAMTAIWTIQVRMSCAEECPRQIFIMMKSTSQLLLYAKQLVTGMNSHNSTIIRESLQQQSIEGNFRSEHYTQVPVLGGNAAPELQQLATRTESKAKGRGGPRAAKTCVICGAALSQGRKAGKRRNVGKHDCKSCKFCYDDLKAF